MAFLVVCRRRRSSASWTSQGAAKHIRRRQLYLALSRPLFLEKAVLLYQMGTEPKAPICYTRFMIVIMNARITTVSRTEWKSATNL